MEEFTAIGVDVGGTKIAAGLVRFPEGVVEARLTRPTLPQRGGQAVLHDVEQMVAELAQPARTEGRVVRGVGVGVCEIVSLEGRPVSGQSVDWQHLSVLGRLARWAPAVLEADVRAAARAEALFGAGKGVRTFLYVSIGTGISCSLVIDGVPFPGARGAAGTMASGPFPVLNGSTEGQMGLSLEEFASGPALAKRYRAVGGVAESGREVITAAAAGDERAIGIVATGAVAIGGKIGELVNVLDPSLVVLGGGLGLCEGLFRDSLVASARDHIWWSGHRELPIVSAQTGADAGIIGAAAAAA